MKKVLLAIFLLSMNCYSKDYRHLVSKFSDSKFGGYYLDIEKTMSRFKISRLAAHEIQNQMRDNLENLSGSYSRVEQKKYLKYSLLKSVKSVLDEKKFEGKFKSYRLSKNEFVVVLDLDETLLSQWYEKADSFQKGFKVRTRDSVPSWVNKKGNSTENPKLLLSPKRFYVRPGVPKFLENVSKIQGFKGYMIFTAKEDKAAWDIYKKIKIEKPHLFKNVLGFYTRNYLRFDHKLKKPSKDLRLFDPSLNHIILIDDNEGRVIQKTLNYRIPKFNADVYIQSKKQKNAKTNLLNASMLEHVHELLLKCENQIKRICFESELGSLSFNGNDTEIQSYLSWLYETKSIRINLSYVLAKKIFEPSFYISKEKFLNEKFPKFINGKLVQ